jgi:hypothetical protein
MNNVIYLISSDGYRDSINLDFYAVDEGDIKKIIYSYRKEYLGEEVDIDSFQIDLKELKVTFRSKPEWDDEWDKVIYYLFKIHRV